MQASDKGTVTLSSRTAETVPVSYAQDAVNVTTPVSALREAVPVVRVPP